MGLPASGGLRLRHARSLPCLLNGTARGRKVGGIRSDYLALAYGSHFIIYKDGVQTLTIVRILHRRMNIGAHL
jgi:toxin ParE1/3/4